MSMNDREVVEAIRQLVLRTQPDHMVVTEVAQEFARNVDGANKNLSICHRWILTGLFAEAVSFGEALDLAQSSQRLMLEGMFAQWSELCRVCKVAAPPSIDQSLLESYSDAWSRFHSLEQVESRHRLLSLQRAPLAQRLQVVRELVDLDPRNPQWLRSMTRLQREALAELVPLVDDALREKDDALAIAVSQLVDVCGGATGEYQEQFARFKTFALAAKARLAEKAARDACHDMHNAATGMDLVALRQASLLWQAAITEFQPDEDLRQSAAASLQLLDAQRAQDQRASSQRDAIGRLELALDQAKPFEEVSMCVAAARNVDATLPPQLLMRIAAIKDAHQAAARRKFARRSIAVAMATVALVSAAWWMVRWQESLEQVNTIAREVDSMLLAGSPDTAMKALASWKESHADLSSAPQVAAVSAKVAAALASEQAEIKLAQEAIDRAAILSKTPAYPVEFDKVAAELKQMSARAPKSMQAQLMAAADQLTSQADASRTVSQDQARAEFMRLEVALNALTPLSSTEQVNPAAWTQRAAQYQSIVDGAKIAASAVANNRDAQTIAQSLQAMALNAMRLREQAEQNAKLYTDANELLRSVEKIPSSEAAYRDLYVRLLPVAADLLNREKKLAAYEHGLKVAEGGVGVEAWRTQMMKAILAGRVGAVGGLNDVDFGDAGTARSLEPLLSKYLLDYPYSPHQEAAELMQALCKRTLNSSANAEGIGAAAAAWLNQSGWVNLGEQSLDEGRKIYRKRTAQLGNVWAQAVQSKNDLIVPAEKLKDRAPLKGKQLGGNTLWPPSQMLVQVTTDLPKASWKSARDIWFDLLAKEAALQPSNPILSWHLQRDLWNVWLDVFAQESDPVDAAAAKWVRSLETQRSVAATDPFVVSASDQAARSEDVRNLALQSLSSMPKISELMKAAKRRDQILDEGMKPAGFVGVMMAPNNGAYASRGIANGKDALIVGKSTDGKWRFFPIRIEQNEVLFIQDTPNPIPQSPQLIFIQGATK